MTEQQRPKVVQFSSISARHGHRWTDDELKTLISMWFAGDELDLIAERFGITPRGVNRQIQRLRANGIAVPRRNAGHRAGRSNKLWTAEEVEYVVRRRNERASTESIANELDRSFLAVQGMIAELRRQGVSVRKFGQGKRRLWSAERLQEAILGRGLSEQAEPEAAP